ncbi:membrane protein [Leptolyngbya sp. Heron Island J]|uniref:hypothetical protein n=1 Tax=Leptolyngbya sp. Heron Island J TaxID=1385935 RepID=UPI0003B9CC8D|nr:hypothetical protein [Leptolyngbya sp. Heron Island J]ESA38208.1 membrane protein [Leptolyngbya sp. Heron Island J]
MDVNTSFVGFALAVCLGLVHVFASRTQWVRRIPQRWWVSIAGGVSIAYIFLDILPELSQAQAEVEHSSVPLVAYLENHVYILALAGLAIFYGLEKLALRSRSHQQKTKGSDCTHPGVFWLHISSFALYNGILGFLLWEAESHGLVACLLLFFALSLHFLVNDIGLQEHHKQAYDRVGRWILAAAILLGWILGRGMHETGAAIAAIWALVAGGIILNVLKEELPEEQESHFGMFVTGAVCYSALLLVL